jgi:hypothetical protein
MQFALHTTPIIIWIIQGQPDIDWLAATLRSAITKRAPWLRSRFARTESGVVSISIKQFVAVAYVS